MKWCDFCNAAKPGWISVKRKLPRLGQIVIVCFPSGYDGCPIYAWGTRHYEPGEGWLWAIKTRGGDIRIGETAEWNDIEPDDDYSVTHWQPIPRPPFRASKKKAKAPAQTAPYQGDQG